MKKYYTAKELKKMNSRVLTCLWAYYPIQFGRKGSPWTKKAENCYCEMDNILTSRGK